MQTKELLFIMIQNLYTEMCTFRIWYTNIDITWSDMLRSGSCSRGGGLGVQPPPLHWPCLWSYFIIICQLDINNVLIYETRFLREATKSFNFCIISPWLVLSVLVSSSRFFSCQFYHNLILEILLNSPPQFNFSQHTPG